MHAIFGTSLPELYFAQKFTLILTKPYITITRLNMTCVNNFLKPHDFTQQLGTLLYIYIVNQVEDENADIPSTYSVYFSEHRQYTKMAYKSYQVLFLDTGGTIIHTLGTRSCGSQAIRNLTKTIPYSLFLSLSLSLVKAASSPVSCGVRNRILLQVSYGQ